MPCSLTRFAAAARARPATANVHAVLAGALALLLGAFLGGRKAVAAEPARVLPAGWLESVVNERGQHCTRYAEQRVAERLVVACGRAGLWEVSFDAAAVPHFVRSYELDGEVTGLFVEPDGRIWVKMQVLQARPLDSVMTERAPSPTQPPSVATLPPIPEEPAEAPAARAEQRTSPRAPPVPAAPSQPPGAQSLVGRVVVVNPDGSVVVSLGLVDGVSISDRIALTTEGEEHRAGGDAPMSEKPVAVGVVTNVSEHSANVRIGLNEHVPLGAIAVPTRAPTTDSLVAPPRVTGVWDVAVMARPFAALGELGGGILLSARAGRRFEGHLHLQALVDPLALADVEGRNGATAANAALIASYDSEFLEVGAGIGAQTVNSVRFDIQPGSGLTLAQIIRWGAEDGLNISARTSIVLFHSEFAFGGMNGELQIPVTRGYWLLFGGGGGDIGYGYGEFGLRVLLSGNGDRGSTFLSTTVGGAGVFKSGPCTTTQFSFGCEQSVSYGGPMAGLGGQWRF